LRETHSFNPFTILTIPSLIIETDHLPRAITKKLYLSQRRKGRKAPDSAAFPPFFAPLAPLRETHSFNPFTILTIPSLITLHRLNFDNDKLVHHDIRKESSMNLFVNHRKIERRETIRQRCELPLSITKAGSLETDWQELTENISSNAGVCFHSTRRFEPGERLQYAITLSNTGLTHLKLNCSGKMVPK
jgi:hypothetical protein